MKNKNLMILGVIAALAAGAYFVFAKSDTGTTGGSGVGSSINIYTNPATDTKPDVSTDTSGSKGDGSGAPASLLSTGGSFVSLGSVPNIVGGSSRTLVATTSGIQGYADIPNSTTKYTALVKDPATNKITGAVDLSNTTFYSTKDIGTAMDQKPGTVKSILADISTGSTAKKLKLTA